MMEFFEIRRNMFSRMMFFLVFLTSYCLASDSVKLNVDSVFMLFDDPKALVNLEGSYSGDHVKNPGYLKNYPNSDFAAIVLNIPLDSAYTSIETKILYVIKNKGTTVREGTRFQSNGWKKTYQITKKINLISKFFILWARPLLLLQTPSLWIDLAYWCQSNLILSLM